MEHAGLPVELRGRRRDGVASATARVVQAVAALASAGIVACPVREGAWPHVGGFS